MESGEVYFLRSSPLAASFYMPWQRRLFKGKKVYALVDDAGELVVQNGRVPMKYSEAEDAKQYAAHPANISAPLGNDRATPSRKKRPAASKTAAPKPASGAQASLFGAPSGTKSPATAIQPGDAARVSTQVPAELRDYPPAEDGIIEVYTDGACSGNPGPCGYGLLIRQGSTYREVSEYLGVGTNNIAELTAIGVALAMIEDKSAPLRIYTDSTYAIGVLTKNWKAKANTALIMGIRAQISEFEDLALIKVKGHAGHPLNERADMLATSSLVGH